ncbi:MAG: PEP-CTERM sorting domain-containing protein [Fimbriimonadaceae bacterium]
MTKPAIVIFVLAATAVARSSGWLDTFDSIDPSWITDRKEPAGFSSEVFDGDARLKLSIAGSQQSTLGAFYYTEGRKRAALLSTPWEVAGQVYIDMDLWSDTLVRSDLWARTGLVGNETGASYPVFGFIHNDAADPFNAGAPNKTWRFRVWDAEAGGWQHLATPVTSGWHDLRILGDGSSFRYYLNNALVYTDATVGSPTQLTDVFVQAYNFGGSNDYSVYWDNVRAQAVPEPFTLGLAAAGLAAAWRRRRR